MTTRVQATEHSLRDFHIIQSIQQFSPLQIFPKSAFHPEDTSSRKTPPLDIPDLLRPENSETLNPNSSDILSPISAASYAV